MLHLVTCQYALHIANDNWEYTLAELKGHLVSSNLLNIENIHYMTALQPGAQ